jgi:ABC-type bacteriocin/lantibiotic exporter with double-glycine peptidase domain
MEMAALVRFDEFIKSQPDGLDREVGQFGDLLSGGQKQKIAVMRALLSEAEILVLDEPTASLDIVSTKDIKHAVDTIRGTRTVILVTHDGDLVKDADHVIVAGADHTFLEGSPAEMAVQSEFYRQLAGA